MDSLPSSFWEKHSAGLGTKGERWYDWVRVPLWRLQLSEEERDYGHYLLVQVAGHRWEIESGFEETKGECGLDHYEVRQWHSWYRHITLSLLAHAVLAVLRIREKKNTGRIGSPEYPGTA
ncbi:transposase [Xenorhabdus ehlersii]|uniref:Transposase n=1 Tax=Xenorhabdus ehlersii TaxID=290111 RepID=A0A2D0INL6_9GAMM|nr:transposase [Xenorhabdus ehlersii]